LSSPANTVEGQAWEGGIGVNMSCAQGTIDDPGKKALDAVNWKEEKGETVSDPEEVGEETAPEFKLTGGGGKAKEDKAQASRANDITKGRKRSGNRKENGEMRWVGGENRKGSGE